MIIEFGRWQLRPVDKNNWALATTEQWEKYMLRKKPCVPNLAKYYQWNTIPNAIIYAASRDLMDKEGTVDAMEFAREFESVTSAHFAAVTKAWDNYTAAAAKTPRPSSDIPQTRK